MQILRPFHSNRAIVWPYDFAGPRWRRQIAEKLAKYPDRSTQIVAIARQQYDACTPVSRIESIRNLNVGKKCAHSHGWQKMAVQLLCNFARLSVVKFAKHPCGHLTTHKSLQGDCTAVSHQACGSRTPIYDHIIEKSLSFVWQPQDLRTNSQSRNATSQ